LAAWVCLVAALLLFVPLAGGDYFLLDHDQRNTLHVGGNVNLPWSSYASTDIYYGSGFTDGNAPPSGPDHLPVTQRLM
jgi:hypothetical protein